MKNKIYTMIFIFMLALGLSRPAAAYGHDHDHHGDWGGNIHSFHDHDFALWAGGRWFHGHHGPRLGWWWVVGDFWYFYPTPVYPYPDPYQPPVVIVEQQAPAAEPSAPPAALPPVVTQEETTAIPAPHGKQYWYYCSDPSGYYPYVQGCNAKWKKVQTTPGNMSAPTGEAPPPPPPPETPKYWYHCSNPAGYYPYVPECSGQWEKVPVSH